MSSRRYILDLEKKLIFDSLKREITINGQAIRLGGRESDILKLLCDTPNTLITKDRLHVEVWGSVYVGDTSLTKAISNLRKALGQIRDARFEIKTVPKEGYIFIIDAILPDSLEEPLLVPIADLKAESTALKAESTAVKPSKRFKARTLLDYITSALEFRVVYLVILSCFISSSLTMFFITS